MEPTVHNRVRDLRQARNWTQEFLADVAGVSRQSINAIERQRYIPSLPLALTLARLFAISVEQLFSLDVFTATAPEPAEPNLNSTPENQQ
jgi:putative transcriptional regulator